MLIIPRAIGESIIIRTEAYHYIGTISDVGPGWVQLWPAVWLAVSSRWGKFLAEGLGPDAEVEPYLDPADIPTHRILDVTTWRHAIPTTAQ